MGKSCARGLEYDLKTSGTIFSHTDRPSPVNNMFIFFSCSKLVLQITNGFVYAALPSIRRLSPQYDRQSKFWCPNETIR